MLEENDIKKLEKRASAATMGYSADENITCYTYGRDVTALLNERHELLVELGKWRMIAEGREPRLPGSEKQEWIDDSDPQAALAEVSSEPRKKGRK